MVRMWPYIPEWCCGRYCGSKSVDYEVLTKYSSSCRILEGRMNQLGYDIWKVNHACGEISSFNEVVETNPYHAYGTVPVNLESTGFVQQHLGTRLHNKV